jgi:hypothetical protein
MFVLLTMTLALGSGPDMGFKGFDIARVRPPFELGMTIDQVTEALKCPAVIIGIDNPVMVIVDPRILIYFNGAHRVIKIEKSAQCLR